MCAFTEMVKRRISSRVVKIFLLLYVIFVVFLIVTINLPSVKKKSIFSCYKETNYVKISNINLNIKKLDDILDAEPQPIPNRSIFFVDTMCGKENERQWAQLKMQQACAVESAALHHNETQIFVLFVRSTYKTNYDSFIQALMPYKNVHYYNLNMWRLLLNTPAEDLLVNRNFFFMHSVPAQVSNLLRLLILWRWGGIYLNFDTITLRHLMDFSDNTVGWQEEKIVGSGVLKFSDNGTGHALLDHAVNDFLEFFEGLPKTADASELLTNILKKRCFFKETSKSTLKCNEVLILPKNVFYEIGVREWMRIFMRSYKQKFIDRLKNSYVLTIWGLMDNMDAKLSRETAYNMLAAKNCPQVYEAGLRKLKELENK